MIDWSHGVRVRVVQELGWPGYRVLCGIIDDDVATYIEVMGGIDALGVEQLVDSLKHRLESGHVVPLVEVIDDGS